MHLGIADVGLITFVAPCSQTQATIESLERATEGNPRHPMRMAFGDNYQPVNA